MYVDASWFTSNIENGRLLVNWTLSKLGLRKLYGKLSRIIRNAFMFLSLFTVEYNEGMMQSKVYCHHCVVTPPVPVLVVFNVINFRYQGEICCKFVLHWWNVTICKRICREIPRQYIHTLIREQCRRVPILKIFHLSILPLDFYSFYSKLFCAGTAHRSFPYSSTMHNLI